MEIIKPRTLSGFMELLPPQQVYFDAMARRLRDSFSLYGFTPLDTPLMEAAEILLAKGGGETEKQIYLLRKGDADLALRYELTASLAKYVALNYSRLTFPFRRYEIGKVYRGERAQRGRFREFYQADIDIIGDGGLDVYNEAEIPGVIYKCFTSLGLERFIIRINNRKVLSGFFEIVGVGGTATDVMRIVDKLDKLGAEKLSETLTCDLGLSQALTDEIIGFITYEGDPFDILEKYRGKNETFDLGAEELAAVKRHITGLGVPYSHFEIVGVGGSATDVMRIVDKLDKLGAEKLSETLTCDLGLSQALTDEIIGFVTYEGDPFDILEKYRGKNETFDLGAEELAAVKRHIAGLGVPYSHFEIDLSIARGLDYYTGTVYETYLTDYPQVGAVCSGGRYDNLAEYYTDRKLPGVGISIGLTRLFHVLQEQGLLNESILTAPSDVLIIPMTENLSHAVALATSMRDAGLRVQIYGEDKKFKTKVSYADKLGIPFVVFLGEDEIGKEMITVKDMSSGNQTTASAGILIAGMSEKIKALRSGAPIRGEGLSQP